MVYAPGHFQQVHQPRERGRRERISVRVFILLGLAIVAVTIYSLTTHQWQTKGGCIDFNYTTMIGGAETHECGAQAKSMCLSPPTRSGIDPDFQRGLFAACRKAHLPLSTEGHS